MTDKLYNAAKEAIDNLFSFDGVGKVTTLDKLEELQEWISELIEILRNEINNS